jgi:NAD(P)H dehydrogenase (quinone)
MNPYILVLYYSLTGSTENLAQEIALGIESIDGVDAKIRTVPNISTNNHASEPAIATNGAPFVSLEDFINCSGIALGSPTRFGNMASPLKHFLDETVSAWQSGALINKPAGCFTSSSSIHGGQETTLLSMMLPLIHHGAIIVGVPYSETNLFTTQTGGSPYGPSHVTGTSSSTTIDKQEAAICQTFGKRLATLALKLES